MIYFEFFTSCGYDVKSIKFWPGRQNVVISAGKSCSFLSLAFDTIVIVLLLTNSCVAIYRKISVMLTGSADLFFDLHAGHECSVVSLFNKNVLTWIRSFGLALILVYTSSGRSIETRLTINLLRRSVHLPLLWINIKYKNIPQKSWLRKLKYRLISWIVFRK